MVIVPVCPPAKGSIEFSVIGNRDQLAVMYRREDGLIGAQRHISAGMACALARTMSGQQASCLSANLLPGRKMIGYSHADRSFVFYGHNRQPLGGIPIPQKEAQKVAEWLERQFAYAMVG